MLQTQGPRASMLGWLLEALWGLLEALGLVATSMEEEQGNRSGTDFLKGNSFAQPKFLVENFAHTK